MTVECTTLRGGWALQPVASVTPEQDEERLIRLARDGDLSAFEGLYRRHAGRVHALCRRLTRHPADAEDLTQEVFVRAWQKIDTFEGRSRFSSWLHRLAVNVAINQHRAAGGTLAWRETSGEEAIEAAPAGPADTAARLDLEEAIAGLPEGARFVFVLHDVHGYRHDEIAEMTGMAAGTSKAHLHRARRALREVLR